MGRDCRPCFNHAPMRIAHLLFTKRFAGSEREIDIGKPNGEEPAEFSEWRWRPLGEMPELVVPFKRPVYEKVAEAFAAFAAPR